MGEEIRSFLQGTIALDVLLLIALYLTLTRCSRWPPAATSLACGPHRSPASWAQYCSLGWPGSPARALRCRRSAAARYVEPGGFGHNAREGPTQVIALRQVKGQQMCSPRTFPIEAMP